MQRKTAYDYDQDLLILFDAYIHGAILSIDPTAKKPIQPTTLIHIAC